MKYSLTLIYERTTTSMARKSRERNQGEEGEEGEGRMSMRCSLACSMGEVVVEEEVVVEVAEVHLRRGKRRVKQAWRRSPLV